MAYPALTPHTNDRSKEFRLLPSIKRSISASSFESLFDSTLLIIRLSFIHASSFVSCLKSIHSVNSSLLRSERTSSIKIWMHSGLYWPGHKRKMSDKAKSSCTDDSMKNKRSVDIFWTAFWNFVNNSAIFTPLKIHGVNADEVWMSSIMVAVATTVSAVLVSTVDWTSVVFVIPFVVEMVWSGWCGSCRDGYCGIVCCIKGKKCSRCSFSGVIDVFSAFAINVELGASSRSLYPIQLKSFRFL